MCEKSTQRITAGVISHLPSPLFSYPIWPFGLARASALPRLFGQSFTRGESIHFSAFAQRASEIEGVTDV